MKVLLVFAISATVAAFVFYYILGGTGSIAPALVVGAVSAIMYRRRASKAKA